MLGSFPLFINFKNNELCPGNIQRWSVFGGSYHELVVLYLLCGRHWAVKLSSLWPRPYLSSQRLCLFFFFFKQLFILK